MCLKIKFNNNNNNNDVTGYELDINVSIEFFRDQSIVRWCRVVCVATLRMPQCD